MRALLSLALILAVPAAATAQPEVLMLGSSSVSGALGRTIDAELEGWGFDVRRRARGASGFARPDFFDWMAELPRLGALVRYAAVLVLVGGNDVQSLRTADGGWIRWQDEEAWTAEYTARLTAFVEGLCERGARRVVVLLPANGGRPRWSERIVRVREAQRAAAAATTCGIALDPGGDELPSRDGVHLTRRGARRVWARIERTMGALLEVAHAEPPPSM